jgi:hypothetical protein
MACCTQPNAVCLSVSVRTYFSISAKMAGQIWLEIGGRTQDGWQSVFHKKKLKKVFKKICEFFFADFFSIFFKLGTS